MKPDAIINTIVDLVNGDLDKKSALSLIRNQLANSDDLSGESKEAVIALVEKYSDKGDLQQFIGKVSSILSNSQMIQDYVDKDR